VKKQRITPMQARFIDEYLIDLNATQAMIRAGYRGKRPDVYAAKLMAKPHIKAAIQQRMDRRQARTEITQDMVIAELARIGFSDQRRVMKWKGNSVELLDSETLSDDAAAMVQEVSKTETLNGGSIKLKSYDKVKALELLGSHLGMWKTKHEHSGPGGKPLAPPMIGITFGDGGPGAKAPANDEGVETST